MGQQRRPEFGRRAPGPQQHLRADQRVLGRLSVGGRRRQRAGATRIQRLLHCQRLGRLPHQQPLARQITITLVKSADQCLDLRVTLAQAAQQYQPQDRERFVQYIQQEPMAAAQLRAPLYEDKVVDFLFTKAEITDRAATRAEIEAFLSRQA